MTNNNNPNRAHEPFRAVLTPHRSLGPRGFAMLMAALCLINFVVGVAFWWLGAWPILVFCGLDVLLIYVAFKLNYRAAQAYEQIEVTPERLTVTSVEPNGRATAFEFNPYWVRVNLSEHHDGRTELELSHHGRRLVFGRCLTDDEKRAFATVLREAIAKARGAVGF
jgi:uncharacterized membrane protein